MYPVQIYPGRRATIIEFTSPSGSWRSQFTEVAPGVYFTDIIDVDYSTFNVLYTDGECYYCDADQFYDVRVRISASSRRDPDLCKVNDKIECTLHESHKYASGIAISGGQVVVVYGTVPDEIRSVHAIDQWQYSPQEYTLEIVGDGPHTPGKVATITACHPARDSDIRYQTIPNYPIHVHFSIWADNNSAYVTLDNTVYQIRF